MEAECLFKQKKYAEAVAAFERVKTPSSKNFEALALLHTAQALGAQAVALTRNDQENQRRQLWQKDLTVADRLIKDHPDSSYLPEALYERGWALQNMGQLDEAQGEYQQVLAKCNADPAKSSSESAARAQFMLGQIQYQQKKHAEAVKSYYLVLYGYPYPQWQADAAYEAAKCFEALHKKSQAVKQYQELIDKFPQSDKVPAAKARIAALQGE
jgi:TolA-binding protein